MWGKESKGCGESFPTPIPTCLAQWSPKRIANCNKLTELVPFQPSGRNPKSYYDPLETHGTSCSKARGATTGIVRPLYKRIYSSFHFFDMPRQRSLANFLCPFPLSACVDEFMIASKFPYLQNEGALRNLDCVCHWTCSTKQSVDSLPHVFRFLTEFLKIISISLRAFLNDERTHKRATKPFDYVKVVLGSLETARESGRRKWNQATNNGYFSCNMCCCALDWKESPQKWLLSWDESEIALKQLE